MIRIAILGSGLFLVHDSWLKVHDFDAGGEMAIDVRCKRDQETRWLTRYDEVVAANKRNPAKHRIEEHDMLNRVKANRNRMNAGEMREERLARFKELLSLTERFRRKNQYE